ncbi:MAG TPA: hypothetical protein VFS61_10570, partial [Anaerolineales bacterium]|nr:hypothetical protein [Anaerolineales bacterium]
TDVGVGVATVERHADKRMISPMEKNRSKRRIDSDYKLNLKTQGGMMIEKYKRWGGLLLPTSALSRANQG